MKVQILSSAQNAPIGKLAKPSGLGPEVSQSKSEWGYKCPYRQIGKAVRLKIESVPIRIWVGVQKDAPIGKQAKPSISKVDVS